MTMTSGGAIDAYNNYYPFGEQLPGLNGTGSSDGRYKYVSVEQDPQTSLYYMHARYYDPWSERFLSVDPMASDSTLAPWSPYQYSFDNPVRFKDPTGKWPGLASTIATAFAEWAYNEVYSARNTIVNSMDYTGNSSTSNSPDVQAQSEGAGPIAIATTSPQIARLQFSVLNNFIYGGGAGLSAATVAALAIPLTLAAPEVGLGLAATHVAVQLQGGKYSGAATTAGVGVGSYVTGVPLGSAISGYWIGSSVFTEFIPPPQRLTLGE